MGAQSQDSSTTNKNKVAKRSVKSFIFSAETEAEEIIRIIIIKKRK